MARKSAFETLKAKLEGEGEGGDTNIDITVIADSDGEAGETVADAIEAGEDIAEGESIAEADDAAEAEAEDLSNAAMVLRQYGLNAGMAAMMQALLPLNTYNISMPAFESLDAAGRNQAAADRLAAGFEAAVEGFWANTKNILKKIWQWIKDLCRKVTTMIGSLGPRIERMGLALSKRTWDESRNKDSKMKQWKRLKEDDYMGKLTGMATTLKTQLKDAANVANAPNDETMGTRIRNVFKDNISAVGVEFKDSDADSKSLTLKDISDFFSTDDVEITKAIFEGYSKGGKYYDDALKCVNLSKTFLPEAEKTAEQGIKRWDKEHIGLAGSDPKSDEEEKFKKALSEAKEYLKALQKILGKTTKCLNFTCTNYLKCGRAILSHTKGEGGANYDKD